jgi:hypothetical protein
MKLKNYVMYVIVILLKKILAIILKLKNILKILNNIYIYFFEYFNLKLN